MTPPKRETFQVACLHWETWGTGREEFPRHSGSLQAPDDLRGDENKILILLRGVCYSQKKENGGLACTPSQILSAKLPISVLALVLMSILFIPLIIANSLLPQFFLRPPFPFLLLHFLTEKKIFSKLFGTHHYLIHFILR